MNPQLPLSIRLRDDASLDNFYPGNNQSALHSLQALLDGKGEPYVYLWGRAGVGRTHLLQACCQVMTQQGKTATYLPMNQIIHLSPDLLEGLEALDLICIDDIEMIATQRSWEEAIFHLYNRLQTHTKKLIIASLHAPAELHLSLPDLSSRLAAGIVYHLQPLTDEAKLAALQLHAKLRGLELTEEVGQFLLNRHSRDMRTLSTLLDQLDEASLIAKRKLTIPFVRETLKDL